MISGLIHVPHPATPDAIDRLADTLSVLVAGVAAGLVGDAVIVAEQDSAPLATVAEGSGAHYLVRPRDLDPWSAGARFARRAWILCLESGDVPAEGWIRTLDRFVGGARPEVTLARLRRPHAGLAAVLAARCEGWVGVRRPRAGDLLRRDTLRQDGALAARTKPRRLLARLDRA